MKTASLQSGNDNVIISKRLSDKLIMVFLKNSNAIRSYK